MRLQLALLPACWLLWTQAARADVIQLSCQVVMERSGELDRRTVLIDTDRRTVRDNDMTFTDGATSPFGPNLQEFVAVEGGRATWGIRMMPSGRPVGVFTYDLHTGGYTVTGRFSGQFTRGLCRSTDEAT